MSARPIKPAIIEITDLKIPAIIGTNDWERVQRQIIVLNIQLSYDACQAVATDQLKHALDYKTLKRKIIAFVKDSRFGLLEKLTSQVLDLIMTESKVRSATVRIDKPKALRYARSVSVTMSSCCK